MGLLSAAPPPQCAQARGACRLAEKRDAECRQRTATTTAAAATATTATAAVATETLTLTKATAQAIGIAVVSWSGASRVGLRDSQHGRNAGNG